MSMFNLPKTSKDVIIFKVERDDGAELSFYADDSCSTVKDRYIRVYLSEADRAGSYVGEVEYGFTPEHYLERLAAFLGYRVEKMKPPSIEKQLSEMGLRRAGEDEARWYALVENEDGRPIKVWATDK